MVTTTSEPVIAELSEVWSSVSQACEGLSAEQWDRPTDCPGWSVRDQLSHLIGTERSIMGDPAPDPPAGLPEDPIARMNEVWVAARRDRSGDQVLAEFNEITARRLAMLEALEAPEWDVVGWSPVGDVPLREFMKVRIFDSWIHEQDVRRALDRAGGRAGAGERITLQRLTSAMGFVLGRKVAPPEGTSVMWEVSGPLPSTVALAMESGRAIPAVVGDEAPTVRFELDAETFYRLGCGRVSPAAALSSRRVVVTGDVELGHRVLEAMAITP